jgi:glutathione S-transferase
MNLFRSEEHLTRWLGDRTPGATLRVADLAALALAWWSDRLDPDWRPHTRDQNQAILDRLGLTSQFWRLS